MSICSHFGYKSEYVEKMGVDAFNKHYKFVDMKENQLMLRSIQANSYPRLKREDAKKLFKNVERSCYPDFYFEQQAQPMTALNKFLKQKA